MTFEGRDESGVLVDTLMDTSEQPNDSASSKLIVALDVATYEEAASIVEELRGVVTFYKIGLELVFGGGLRLARELLERRNQVFLDMKLSDIGNTVEKSVRNIARLGVDYLTVHALDRKTLNAAAAGRGASKLKLLGVTVLTNLTESDLAEQGIKESPSCLAARRAKLAFDAGLDGVIASGFEAKAIRELTDEYFIIKTPGIRPPGASGNDQARAMTPRQAILAGADYLVVGRPILSAPDRRRAALEIQDDIRAGLELQGRRKGL